MPRKQKPNPAQIPLLELATKTASGVPAIRQAVREWVAGGYKGATETSKILLNYWFQTDHRTFNGDKFQYHYFQREAVETLIYLYEVAQQRRHKDLIQAYASLPEGGQSIPYTDSAANLRYYEPDFVAVTQDEVHHLLETKGREDIDVKHKDRAAQLWCENATMI